MPSQKKNILESNQYTKSDKMIWVIYLDFEYLIENGWMCKQSGKTFKNKYKWTYYLWILNIIYIGFW